MNINAIIYEVLETYTASAGLKGIKLYSRLDDHGKCLADVDKDLTLQVIDNLISNALKFSPAESIIWVKTFERMDSVILEIQDEGPGITKEDMPRLFTKNGVLSARPTGNEASNGLGLFIVKKYMEKMNGKAWCQSTPGQGTIFFLEFKTLLNKEEEGTVGFKFR